MDYKVIMRADEPDSNGEIIPREVLEQAVKERNKRNDQKIEIYHSLNEDDLGSPWRKHILEDYGI